MFVATRSAIPGELRSRRTRVRFTDHSQFLLLTFTLSASFSALRASRTADSFRPRSAMMASVLPSSLSFGATQPMALCNRKSL